DFNETTFSLNTDGNLERAIAGAGQLPMMSAKRVIIITDVRISQTGFRDTVTEDDEPLLSSYLGSPEPTAVIILIADDLNGVRKMGKFLRERTAAVNFEPLDDRQFLDYARKEFQRAGIKADERQI